MTEEWKHVPGLGGYEVSSLGRVRGPDGIMDPTFTRAGYPVVSIRMVGGYLVVHVHQLVCRAWYGEPQHYIANNGKTLLQQVRHLNDNRSDARPGNLKWGTAAENHSDSFRNGSRKRIMTRDAIQKIQEDPRPVRLIATEYGVHPNTIYKAKRRSL